MSTWPHDDMDGPSEGAEAADEYRLRRALSDAVTEMTPGAWPAKAVLERARKRRRARRLAIILPALALIACGGVLAVGLPSASSAKVPPADSRKPTAHPTPTRSSPTWPKVRVVQPDEPFAIGLGKRMRVDHAQQCVQDTPAAEWTCKSLADGNVASGTVSVTVNGGQGAAVYTPLYAGPGRVAGIALTIDGRDYPVQVMTLPGDPGFVTGYASGPEPEIGGSQQVTIQAYDSHGKLLASTGPMSLS